MAGHQPATCELFCLIFGESNPFAVNIAKNETVSDLQDAMKEKQKPKLDSIDANNLTLYLINIIDDEELLKSVNERINCLPALKALNPTKKLSTVFETTPAETVHILVQLPKRKRKYNDNLFEDNLIAKRRRLLETMPNHPPSSATMQTMSKFFEGKIDYNRPALHETIPIALLHEVFGTFLDDSREHKPTADDNRCLGDLRNEMLKEYTCQDKRADTFRFIVQHYGIALEPGKIRNYTTAGDARVGNHVFLITESKNELSTDPLLQAFLYYIASLDRIPEEERVTPLPCLIIYYAGPFIGFAGAVTGEKPQVEPLTPLFTFQANVHNMSSLEPIARALYAARRAYNSLREIYSRYEDRMPTNGPMFPYQDHYMDKGKKFTFKYLQRISSKRLLFLCMRTDNQEWICVKFTQKYSQETHGHCASHGIAPQLYAVDLIPGGWFMIAMEFLPYDLYKLPERGDKSRIEKGLRLAVDTLHRNGFVHGDIRVPNVLIRREWDSANEAENVKLIDFDWAGPENATIYPPHVNKWNIVRSDDVEDGVVIKKEHDLFMLEELIKSL